MLLALKKSNNSPNLKSVSHLDRRHFDLLQLSTLKFLHFHRLKRVQTTSKALIHLDFFFQNDIFMKFWAPQNASNSELDLWCAEVLTPSHHMLTRFSSSLKFVICQGQVRLLFFKIVWTKFTLIWARFGPSLNPFVNFSSQVVGANNLFCILFIEDERIPPWIGCNRFFIFTSALTNSPLCSNIG